MIELIAVLVKAIVAEAQVFCASALLLWVGFSLLIYWYAKSTATDEPETKPETKLESA